MKTASRGQPSNKPHPRKKKRLNCFVLMPFSSQFDAVYENAIRPAISSIRGTSCLRADEVYGPRPIMADIWKSIQQSVLIVADLTERNPNVLYELGLAHAIQKPAVLLAQSIDDIPFDLRSIRCLIYGNDRDGRENLKVRLREAISEFLFDFSRGLEQELIQYLVLSPHHPASQYRGRYDGRLPKVSADLRAANPIRLMRALRALAEKESNYRNKTHPELIATLLEHLNNPYPEIQEVALNCLEKFGTDVHTHFLYPLAENGNSAIQCAAITAISANNDGNAEKYFIEKLDKHPSNSVRRALIEALGRIGTSVSVRYFSRILQDTTAQTETRCEAIAVMCGIANRDSLEAILALDLAQLDGPLLECVASKIGEVGWLPAPERQKIHNLLLLLAADPRGHVAGAACASFCILSNYDDGFLDRTTLWKLLEEQSHEALLYFFHSTFDEGLFDESESSRLVSFAQRLPELRSSFAWLFQEIGGKSVAPIMKGYLESNEEGLWALAYFSRCPSKLAQKACMKELREGSDINRSVLAATCLSRLGVNEGTAFLTEKIVHPEVYSWVQRLAVTALDEARSQSSSKSASARIAKVIQRVKKTN